MKDCIRYIALPIYYFVKGVNDSSAKGFRELPPRNLCGGIVLVDRHGNRSFLSDHRRIISSSLKFIRTVEAGLSGGEIIFRNVIHPGFLEKLNKTEHWACTQFLNYTCLTKKQIQIK